MNSGRNTVVSVLGFGIVLFIAILCRPYTSQFSHPIVYMETEDYDDVIGIELGNTYSQAGVIRNHTFEIISDQNGRSEIPNYVAFPGFLVGFEAKEHALTNPKNTVYDMRRLIGRNYSDPEVQRIIKELPYEISDVADKPMITITQKDGNTHLAPEEVSALILKKLKDMAENHLNKTVSHAVIAVPSYFNEYQRQATRDAAAMANLTVLRLINEATSIGIAHELDTSYCGNDMGRYYCHYVVYDKKDTEIEATLLSIDRGVFEILGTTGLKNGETRFQKAQSSSNASELDRILGLTQELLNESQMGMEDLDGIVVASDRSDIAEIQTVLKVYFPSKRILTPSRFGHGRAIVYGAARQGNYLNHHSHECVSFADVNVLSLGIETSNGSFLRIINRHTWYPSRKSTIVSTVTEFQEKVEIKILEGERQAAGKNKLIGKLEFTRDQWNTEGAAEIEIAFTLDANEILTASANVEGGSELAKSVIPVKWNRYTSQEIEDIVNEGKNLYDEDLRQLIKFPVNIPNGVRLLDENFPDQSVKNPETPYNLGNVVWRWLFS